MRSGGRCWRFNGCSELGAEAIGSGELALVANTVGVGGEGVHCGESRTRIVEVSVHIMIHGSLGCRWSRRVRKRRSCLCDAFTMSGVGSEGTCGKWRQIRIDEGSKGVVVHGSCRCPCYQGVSIGCSWIHDVSIVSGVSSKGTSGQE